jgi:hypothetical protein
MPNSKLCYLGKTNFINKIMGKANKGIFGAINGKVGNLVFYNLNGEDLVRTLGEKTGKLSKAQLANCDKMALIVRLFSNMKPFLKVGFGNKAKGTNMNYHNLATSTNKAHAIELIDGKVALNFEKLQLTQGDALGAKEPAVELVNGGLSFSWTYDELEDWNARNDQVMLMAYFPEDNEASFITSGARRSERKDVLEIHPTYRKKQIEIYISFVSDDRESVATSVYLARLN